MREDMIVESSARKDNGGGCSAAVPTAGAGVIFDAYLLFEISERNVSGADDDNVTAAGSVWTMAVISFLATLKLNISRRKEGN